MSSLVVLLNLLHWLVAMILFALAAHCFRHRRKPVARALMVFFLLAGNWALFAALIFHVPTLEAKIVLNRFKFISPALLSSSILAIALSLHGKRPWSIGLLLASSVVPVLTVIIMWSPHHLAVIRDYRLITLWGREFLAFGNGPWFTIHEGQARIVLTAALGLILTARQGLNVRHRLNSWFVVLSIAVPFVGDTLVVRLFPHLRFLQIVPAMLLLTAGIMVYAIQRHHLISVVPFARNRILDSTSDGYVVFDADGKLVDFNQAAARAMGLSKTSLGRMRAELIACHPAWADAMNAEHPTARQCLVAGEWYDVVSHALEDSFNGRVGIVTTLRNVTLRKRAEQDIEEVSQMKTKILATIGHDLLGNLAATAIVAEGLNDSTRQLPPEDVRAGLEHIHAMAKLNIAFVEQLLMWSKAQLGLEGAQLTDVDLSKLVDDVITFLRPAILERRVQVQVSSKLSHLVSSDANALAVVLRNLLSNAVKFTPVAGTVKVFLNGDERMFTIIVEDDGPGIASEDLTGLFEPKSKGRSGLGLFLCRSFVERLGGTIQVESAGGCRFVVTIPVRA